jgi:hypothetical protein
MYRVTRKQLIRQDFNLIEFEDSQVFGSRVAANAAAAKILSIEILSGYQWYGPDKVIFESPTFYRSVQVTIEEIK